MKAKTIVFSDGRKLEIHTDDDAESPRTSYDNMGTMACFHERHDFGDKDHGIDHTEFGGWDEMAKWIVEKMDGAIVLPLFLYDHSGQRIKVGSFDGLLPQGHAEFDSGQIGFIFVTNAKVKEEYGDDPEALKKAEAYLRGEVETLDQYLRGDIWGYAFSDDDGEAGDSCWGFYGDDPIDNGMGDHLDEQYRNALMHEKGILKEGLADDAVKVVTEVMA